MKKLLLLTILTLLGLPAWAQTTSTTSSTSTTGSTTTGSGVGSELKAKLEAMTPAQRHEFLENHPRIRARVQEAELKKYEGATPAQQQQFAQKHPEAAQRLANASEAGSTSKDPGHPRVNEVNGREGNQQQRISQGVSSGTLTSQQDARLEKGETHIQNQEAGDLAKHDGHLTKAEQLRLNHEANRESRHIYADKHD